MKLSGYVIYGIVIITVNLKILVMTTGIKPFIYIISILSIVVYWLAQAIYFKLIDPEESNILGEQFKYPSIIFLQIIFIFFFILIELAVRKH